MDHWKRGLFDTCSLITIDKILAIRPAMAKHFPKTMRALEKSFSADQLREKTAKRIRRKVTIQELPSANDLASILSTAALSPALAEVDKLVYSAAVHFRLPVITGDRTLAKAVKAAGLEVIDVASILRKLVRSKKLSKSGCERLLNGLAKRKDLLLGTSAPTWSNLESHSFPDRKASPQKKHIL